MDTATPFSISPAQFNARFGTGAAPLVLDVRRDAKFAGSDRLLAGALRCAPQDVAAFASSHPPGEALVYCVYGHNVSEEAVITLRKAGWDAHKLQGGLEGGEPGVDDPQTVAAWRAHPPLSFTKRADWGVTGTAPSRWITRVRPKIDRVACPWLIQRFIDPRAEFFYVPATDVLSQAQALNAVAYDMPGAPVSHAGELCSFDALLRGFALTDAALDLLATIVRGADTNRLDLAAPAAGLLAVSLGMSRLHATDDQAMLQAALPVYDALYAWCRERVQQLDESHNRTPA